IDGCLGREAITKWQVLDRGEKTTRLVLTPVTGRSHQLRVHMQFLGNPILGDEFYAPANVYAMSDRLLLHAETLEIVHPSTHEPMKFHDPCPF
ncbi:MAG: pseudouridine synthase, partial [Pseudomonadota bacterium]